MPNHGWLACRTMVGEPAEPRGFFLFYKHETENPRNPFFAGHAPFRAPVHQGGGGFGLGDSRAVCGCGALRCRCARYRTLVQQE